MVFVACLGWLASWPRIVTQRGDRRRETFVGVSDDNYRSYLALMAEWCRRRRQPSGGVPFRPISSSSGEFRGHDTYLKATTVFVKFV